MGHHRLKAAAGASPADPYFSSTSLLLLGNGTNGGQNNTFVDSSTNNFTVTRNGNTTQGSFSPFTGAGGSGYFDGSGDYLELPSNSAFAFGTGDFTIEFWAYLNSQSTFVIYDPRTAEPQLVPVIYTASGQLRFYANGTDAIIGSTLSALTWYHIALTRSGTSTKLFVNGTQSGSTYTDSNNYIQTRPVIGVYPGNLTSYFNGYLSSLRILKGTAQYTATFTPPTSPLTAITNTSLLLNFTNASILDSTAKNDLETVGDAQISTSVKKFGTGSLKFDGTGDYLQGPSSGNLNFGTGDFTVECWIYLNSTTSSQVIINGTASNSFGLRYGTGYLANNGLGLFRASIADLEYCSFTFSTGQWYHIAVVRASSVIKYFVDGVQKTTQGSGGSSYSFGAETNIRVALADNNGEPFNGYIDDLRITKGVARYTASFTPPSAQLPAR